ncbi:Uu.00g121880.m01.CDS01 [Anthostomella pinea]|uniref:Uu.00g121880.m01.CDS01 n=1 Tax=Anthostomella pinea TaxID=933095 RepID=A0AAI8VI42_9PEZI|nr:Uu.00g121880.m01.CDS01 [Anthostomella pinea]
MHSISMQRSLARTAMRRRCRMSGDGLRWTEGACRRHASSQPPPPRQKAAAKPLPFKPTKPAPAVPQQQPQAKAGTSGANSSNKSKKQPVAELVRGSRWIGLLGFGGATLCLGAFSASLAMHWREEPAPCHPLGCEPEAPTGRPAIESPYEFDLHLDKSEWRLGVTKLRRRVASEARGHVLEVAVGTGRNLEFYDWGVVTESLMSAEEREERKKKRTSLLTTKKGLEEERQNAVLSYTGLDISPSMLDIALTRMRQVVPHLADRIPKKPSFAALASSPEAAATSSDKNPVFSLVDNKIRILQSDAQTALPAPPSPTTTTTTATTTPKKYDTILQTFGLCSVHDPVTLLTHMASSLQPTTGRIILLEHGRSDWEFLLPLVNGLLDRSARGHFARFGCWWNRDIEAIVREAAARHPGLEVMRVERPGWATAGTHVLVEMRVRELSAAERAKVAAEAETGAQGKADGGRGWWASIWSPSAETGTGTKLDEPKKD